MSFDTHAHVDIASAGKPLQWKALLDRARHAGIRGILIPAVHPKDWNSLMRLVCAAYQPDSTPRLFVALGLHPWALKTLTDDEVDAAMAQLEQRLHLHPRHPAWIALGETGLDFRKLAGPHERALQLRVFRRHLHWSRQTGLPLTIHCVQAYGALLQELRDCPPAPSIIHGFSGKPELARQLCGLGHAIGIGGMVTHPRAHHVRRALPTIPPDKILLETDAPDQTPWSRRPAPNEPSFLLDIAQAAAQILGETRQSLLKRCEANAHRVFNLPPPTPLTSKRREPSQP